MNSVLKVVLSLSLSGSLLILLLFLSKIFLKNRTSRRWQYYIWLVVIARLLLPFTPEVSVVGMLFQQAEQTIIQSEYEPAPAPGSYVNPASEFTHEPVESAQPNQESNLPATSAPSIEEIGAAVIQHLWLAWLGVALILLIRKITAYQSFVKYIKAGCVEVADVKLLDRLAQIGEQTGVKRPVELCANSLISSPLLFGFLHPCIVFPTVDLPEADFEYTIRHELIHYKHRDLFYKWLVQLTICVHWFNPLVWWMGREINRTCELACDEAVIRTLDEPGRRAYGDTLLRAMETGGGYKNSLASVTLNESAELLKERLGAIMRYKKASKLAVVLSFVLAGALTMGAAAAGAYPGPAKVSAGLSTKKGTHSTQNTPGSSSANQAERYYKAGSLPLFAIEFSRLGEKEQTAWLEKLYNDGDFAFFSVAVRSLDEDDPLIAAFAEKAYMNGKIAFFSTLTDCMDETELELWLARALEDGRWNFQSMLFDKLDMNEEKDAQEKEWAEQQMAEYRAVGVTKDGKDYYYQGKLVNIFLDTRPNKSFYTLDVNPAGTVNIKIIRNGNGQITGVAYMTEAEVKELLDDMYDPDDDSLEMETLELKGTTYYLVANEAQLRAIGTGKYGMNQNYMQQADIYLSTNEWVPIGTWDHPFTGSFNGNGFEITGLTMKDPDTKIIGLFGVAKNAHIYNVTMRDYDIMSAGKNISGKSVGAVLAIGQGSRSHDNHLFPKTVVEDDWDAPEETWDGSESISVPVDIAKVKDGEYVWLGTYTLDVGDRVFYNVTAESGKQLDVGFSKPGQAKPNPCYYMVSCPRTDGKLEVKSGAMTWKAPVKPGEYNLFVHTEGGTLANVKGYITIIKTMED